MRFAIATPEVEKLILNVTAPEEALESQECGVCAGLEAEDFGRGDCMAQQPYTMAEEKRRPDPNEKLVKVFDSEQEPEAMVVKGLLDSAEIENDLMSGSLVQEMFPGLGGMIILVREEDAEKARRLIAESRQSALQTDSPASDSVDDDDDATEELPAKG